MAVFLFVMIIFFVTFAFACHLLVRIFAVPIGQSQPIAIHGAWAFFFVRKDSEIKQTLPITKTFQPKVMTKQAILHSHSEFYNNLLILSLPILPLYVSTQLSQPGMARELFFRDFHCPNKNLKYLFVSSFFFFGFIAGQCAVCLLFSFFHPFCDAPFLLLNSILSWTELN